MPAGKEVLPLASVMVFLMTGGGPHGVAVRKIIDLVSGLKRVIRDLQINLSDFFCIFVIAHLTYLSNEEYAKKKI